MLNKVLNTPAQSNLSPQMPITTLHSPKKVSDMNGGYCVKSARIRSYFGQYFPAFGLNTERYHVSLRIQSECGKIRNTNTFYAVCQLYLYSTLPRSKKVDIL